MPARLGPALTALVLMLGFATSADAAPEGALVQLPGTAGCRTIAAAAVTDGCAVDEAAYGARGVSLSPDGQNLYSVSPSGLLAYTRDGGSGELSALAAQPALARQPDVAPVVSPDGRNAYAGSVVFARGPATGALTPLAGVTGCLTAHAVATGCTRVDGAGTSNTPLTASVVSPDGHFVYVAAPDEQAILSFSRHPATGALTQLSGLAACAGLQARCSPATGLHGVSSLVISPDGRSLYASADFTSGTVAVFSRNASSGALTQLPGAAGCLEPGAENGCTPVRGLHGATDVAVSPDGDNVYVTSGFNGSAGVVALARDSSTGALAQLAGTDGCLNESDSTCIDTDTLVNAHGIVLSGDGRFAYAGSFDGALVALARDPASGALAELSHPGGCLEAPQFASLPCTPARAIWQTSDLALSPDGKNVYASAGVSGLSSFKRAPAERIADPPLPQDTTPAPTRPTGDKPASSGGLPGSVVVEQPHSGGEPEVVLPALKLIAQTSARGLRSGNLRVVVRCDRACSGTVAAYARVKRKLYRLAGKRVRLEKAGDKVVVLKVEGKSLRRLNGSGAALVFRARAA
jgi:DNA-binding beta-propeller fold protein YncE